MTSLQTYYIATFTPDQIYKVINPSEEFNTNQLSHNS